MQTWNQEQPNLATLLLLASALAAQTNYDLLVQGGRVIGAAYRGRLRPPLAGVKTTRVVAGLVPATTRV